MTKADGRPVTLNQLWEIPMKKTKRRDLFMLVCFGLNYLYEEWTKNPRDEGLISDLWGDVIDSLRHFAERMGPKFLEEFEDNWRMEQTDLSADMTEELEKS
jgi:hypothetical protein